MNISKKEERLLGKITPTKSVVALTRLLGPPDITYYSPDSYNLPDPSCEINKKEITFNPDTVISFNAVFGYYRLEVFIKENAIVNMFLVPLLKQEKCGGNAAISAKKAQKALKSSKKRSRSAPKRSSHSKAKPKPKAKVTPKSKPKKHTAKPRPKPAKKNKRRK